MSTNQLDNSAPIELGNIMKGEFIKQNSKSNFWWTVALSLNIIIILLLFLIPSIVKYLDFKKYWATYETPCQTLSNEYGIYNGITYGTAPVDVQQIWRVKKCDNNPTNRLSCQQLKDEYNITHGNYENVPFQVMNRWIDMGCDFNTRVL